MTDPLIESLARAVDAAPEDLPLRLHLIELLLAAGRRDEAVRHCANALQRSPGDAHALRLMARAISAGGDGVAGPGQVTGPVGRGGTGRQDDLGHRFDWAAAESQLGDLPADPVTSAPAAEHEQPPVDRPSEQPAVTLADVGGMDEVKRRLEAAFLAPMRNPDLRRLYGTSLRGGLLLYGPPGCGKTFLGRAIAGELGARFLVVGLSDVLEMWLGRSERNLHEVFDVARNSQPVVLFLDEIDALGQKRSQIRSSGLRTVVNQLLTELDGVATDNEGVFVVAATNQPWDVDPALRRPGRLDRTVLVLPPDPAARAAIFDYHLRQRPVRDVDVARLAEATDGYSGADIRHVCETAAERALLDAGRSGVARPIGMSDLLAALREVRPSPRPWFESVRNVVLYANADGSYDELREYMKRAGLL